jgi:hypothetical protein
MALGVDSTSNRNEYEEYSWKVLGGKGRPVSKSDNLTAIYEPIVEKMWEPQHLTTLWASTACYRDTFILLYYYFVLLFCELFYDVSIGAMYHQMIELERIWKETVLV